MKNRRIFIMLTVMMIVLSVVASSYQIGENRKLQVNQTVNVSEKFEVNVVTARESSKNLMRFFEENDKRNRVDTGEFRYTTSGISSDGFPDYFAGKYINADGNLVVLLTEEYKDGLLFANKKGEKAKEEIAAVSGQNDLIFGYVKYSYKELLNTTERIFKFLTSDSEVKQEATITNFGIDQVENIIEVGMYPLNAETEKWFRENIADEDYIVFTETGPNTIEATASIRPGGKILAETGNSYFSVGFRAYKGSTEGFVTCGHSFHFLFGNLNVLNMNNDILGMSYESERKFHDLLDAAFVRKTTGNTFINTLYDSYSSISVASGYVDPDIGDLVHMCGQKTNSQDGTLLQGYVLSKDENATYYGEQIGDLYSVGYYADVGDSGGIVFKKNGSVANAVGIQAARNNNTGCSYVCKAGNIVSEFGLTIQ